MTTTTLPLEANDDTMSEFAETILRDRYAHDLGGRKETWREVAYRVAYHVLSVVNVSSELIVEVAEMIAARKFMPGGRYLAAAGRELHQTQNCVLLRAEDTREGWAKHLSNATLSLMTGAGVGGEYSALREERALLKRSGGFASGPIPLIQAVNEVGRAAKAGGNRRAALWAGLKWSHPDIFKYAVMKDWPADVRAKKAEDFNYPAPFDHTNISIGLDDEFFKAYRDPAHPKHQWARDIYRLGVKLMLSDAEPGFTVDIGENAGEDLRNAPVCADTHVLTDKGYIPVGSLVGRPVTVWTGEQWAKNVVFTKTMENAPVVKVTMTGGRVIRCEPSHEFLVEKWRGRGAKRTYLGVERVKASELEEGDNLHVSLPAPPEGRCIDRREYTLGFIVGDGTVYTDRRTAELTLCTPEKQATFPFLDSSMVRSVSPDGRGYVRVYFAHDEAFNEVTKTTIHTSPSFLAGLFDADGNCYPEQGRVRLSNNSESFLRNVARALEEHGILASVSRNGHSTYGDKQTYQLVVMEDYVKRFFEVIPVKRLSIEGMEGYKPYRRSAIKVLSVEPDGFEDVFCADVKVPEHSFQAEGVIISNCTEVTSRDDSDICNLGSINMARIYSLEEMRRCVELGTIFLLAGTIYSDVPYQGIADTREKNRRLGLGLMGVHEWLLVRDLPYAPTDELVPYLNAYAESTTIAARYADLWGISRLVKTRAIAPTGTIGIVAETTTGIEPIFCAAYFRRYYDNGTWRAQYVIDPTARRLVAMGVDPDKIEDAYVLAEDVERRVAFQAWIQGWVDHGISSTVNLPAWGSAINNEDRVDAFADMLMKYLPRLRGITCYPDGCRGGQPLNKCSYKEAAARLGEVITEQVDVCSLRGGGSCGV